MQTLPTQTLPATASGLAEAADLLRGGALVAFPTETVYGLGGDATNSAAVAAIFAAKGRPAFNPLIVHVPDLHAARQIADFTPDALALAARFWPGPLTLVLPLLAKGEAGIAPLVTAGLNSVAIRVPAHPVAQALLRLVGRPVAAPSANLSGRISPTRAAHVLEGLTGRISAVIDGGPCAVGVESTIVGFAPGAILLRPGGITAEALEQVLGHPVALRGGADAITAPGQLASHYAPNAALRLNVTAAAPGEVLIGFGPVAGHLTLSATGDLAMAAAALFQMLRQADGLAGPQGRIAVAPIPHHGLGVAINDRLARAAAPRT